MSQERGQHGELERAVRHYLNDEVRRAGLRVSRWDATVARLSVRARPKGIRHWGSTRLARRAFGIAAIVAIMSGVAVFVGQPWDARSPEAPRRERSGSWGFAVEVASDKQTYVQGDSIGLWITYRNMRQSPLRIENFPGRVTLDRVGSREDDEILVPVDQIQIEIAPGAETTARFRVPEDVALPPGWYTVRVDIKIEGIGDLTSLGEAIFVVYAQ